MKIRAKKMYGIDGWEYTAGKGANRLVGWSSDKERAERYAQQHEAQINRPNTRRPHTYAEEHARKVTIAKTQKKNRGPDIVLQGSNPKRLG